jgi:hypothetical protein
VDLDLAVHLSRRAQIGTLPLVVARGR